MGIKRYTAYKDNTITNAYKSNLTTRGTGSNMGKADSLEVFSIFAQAASSSNEQTRILVQFPVSSSDTGTTILNDRGAGKIPASGSVNFFLKMFNVAHDQSVPNDFTLVISPISQSWEEGYGLDMENYSDQTYNGTGSNWINAAAHTVWTNVDGTTLEGGSYLSASWIGSPTTFYNEFNYKKTISDGTDDLELDITPLVEQWIKGAHTNVGGYENYGVGIHLTSSQESGSRSYYTKKFSARSSEFFFNRPIIEARWDSSRKDQRGSFYLSSSAMSATDNKNTIYFYNYVRGQLKNLPNVGTGAINVSVYTSGTAGTQLTTTPAPMPVTGGYVATGIYSASFALNTTESVVYDRWWSGSSDVAITDSSVVVYHTGSITPIRTTPSNIFDTKEYIANITNLRSGYFNNDAARLRLYTRERNWNPTIYTVATANIENSIIDDAYFKVFRVIDDKEVIPYGTGSLNHTRLSYDVSGSYFDLDMSLLEVGYEYGIKFIFYTNGTYDEHNTTFKFKVIE